MPRLRPRLVGELRASASVAERACGSRSPRIRPRPNLRTRTRTSSIDEVAAERPEPGTFLARLAEQDREAVLALGGSRRFARGERLMHQNEPGGRVLLLLEGHVKVSVTDARGHEMVLSFRETGDILGERAFQAAAIRARAVSSRSSPSRRGHWVLSSSAAFSRGHPTAALTLIDVISQRVSPPTPHVSSSETSTPSAGSPPACSSCANATGIPLTREPESGYVSPRRISGAGRRPRVPVSPARCGRCGNSVGSPQSAGRSPYSTSTR